MADLFSGSQFSVLGARPDTGSIAITGSASILFPVIFTEYRLSKREKVQIVEAFSEAVHLYAFGGGVDRLMLSGHILTDVSSGGSLVVSPYDSGLRAFQAAKQGQLVVVTGGGGTVFPGVVDSLEFGVSSAANNMSNFQLSMIGSKSAYYVGDGGAGISEGDDDESSSSGSGSSWGGYTSHELYYGHLYIR